MVQKRVIFAFLLILLAAATIGYHGINFPDHPETPDITPQETPDDTLRQGGKPCTSEEERHQRADEIGYWVDGILIPGSLSNFDLLVLLWSKGVPETTAFDRTSPGDRSWHGHVGYYIAANESHYREIREAVEADMYAWRMRFYSPNIVFISPSEKKRGEKVLSPIFLLSGGNWSREEIYQDVLARGVPVQRADVVRFDLSGEFTPAEREQILRDLNADDRVLFAFKEYRSGDIC